jgi:uncharacterized protein (TIGR02145 family)
MKKILITFLVGIISYAGIAQNVGIGTNTPNASAVLDASSTTQGFLPPRMTYAQRNAIVNPAAGLIVYCTDCANGGEMQYFNGTRWINMSIGAASTPFTTPIISTNTITNISSSGAVCGGNITSNGGANITARGICWSTSANPTISLTTKTVDGTGTGAFTSSITGLTANTTYYVRAYATNSVGTTYGAPQTFTTASVAVLPSVTIGTQAWTNKNLDVACYRNGDVIPQVTDYLQWAALTTGAWCWYNNDSATYAATYGRLYNWYAVNDARGLAPQGWHIPTDAEWNKLVKYLDAGADTTCTNCTQSTIGGAMKSTSGWNAPNTGATNSSGFAGLPGGFRTNDVRSYYIGSNGYWWSSTESNTTSAWARYLYGYNSYVGRSGDSGKFSGFSVRCVRD